MSTTVIGRGFELEAIERVIRFEPGAPVVVVFEGEPGVGKTTVLHAEAGILERAGESIQPLAKR